VSHVKKTQCLTDKRRERERKKEINTILIVVYSTTRVNSHPFKKYA